MDLWYSHPESGGADFRIKIRRALFSAESQEKRIDIFETELFGRILVLDGRIALSELEGESYREMAVHVPLNVHRGAAAALVIGGGDGGVISELIRHRQLERITVVEPNSGVIEASRRWFPAQAASFADARVRIIGEDAGDYVRDAKDRYDVIVVDDSSGKAAKEGANLQAFYCDCFRILSGDGILVNRAGSADYSHARRDLVTRAGKIKRLFPIYRLYRARPPAGEPGELLLGFASKRLDPLADYDDSLWEGQGIATRCYTPAVHRAAFALPLHVEELLAGV